MRGYEDIVATVDIMRCMAAGGDLLACWIFPSHWGPSLPDSGEISSSSTEA